MAGELVLCSHGDVSASKARPTFSDTSGITVLYVHCIADPIADLDPIESITKLCGPGKTIANLSIITTKWTEGSARSRAAEKERLDTYLTTNNLRAMVGDPQRFDDSKDSAERILMDALKKPPCVSFVHVLILIFRNDIDVNSPSVTPPYSPSGALSGQVADHAPAGNGAAKGKDESGGCCCVQ